MIKSLKAAQNAIDDAQLDTAQRLAEYAWTIANKYDFQQEKVNSLLMLSQIGRKQNESGNAIKFLLDASNYLEKANDSLGVSDIKFELGEIYFHIEAYQKAYEYYLQSFDYLPFQHKKNAYLVALEKAGICAEKSENNDEAITIYSKLLYHYKTTGNTDWVESALKNLINAFNRGNHYKNALDYNYELLEVYFAKKDSSGLANTYNNLGYNYSRLNEHQNALGAYQLALNLDKKRNEENRHPNTLVNIGISYQNLGDQNRAVLSLKEAYKIRIQKNHYGEAGRILNIIAQIYLKNKDSYNALNYNSDAIAIAKKGDNLQVLVQAYLTQSQIYQNLNEYEKALEYYQSYFQLGDSLLMAEKNALAASEQKEAVIEKRDQDIKLKLADEDRKDQENKRLQLELEKQSQELELIRANQQVENYIIREQQLDQERQMQTLLAKEQERTIELLQKEKKIKDLEIQERENARKEELGRIELLEKSNENQKLQLANQNLRLEQAEASRTWMTVITALVILGFIMSTVWLVTSRKQNRKLANHQKEIQLKNKELELKNKEVLAQSANLKKANEEIRLSHTELEQKTEEIMAQAEKLRTANIEIKQKNDQLELKNEEIATQRDAISKSFKELEITLKKLKFTQTQLVDAEKMASLGQLTAGIAHEINNPINFVSANVKPLRRDFSEIKELIDKVRVFYNNGSSPEHARDIKNFAEEIDIDFILEEVESLIAGIEEGAFRTKEIVSGLRNFSRRDESDFKLSDIHQGINSTLTLLKSKFKNRINLKIEFGDIPKIECHPGQLNQVFMNILNNASQAITGKGEVTVKTEPGQKNKNIKISISDSGKGIPKEIQSKIFEPFFTTKDVGEGTGLGLSISYGIIERHNGSIKVKSQVGKGTTFTITLPINQPKG
ncbi:ATP-binding protein [Flexithrix dorotheae]|uniref:ATP-binding protein n=1 Tax=Flexithrix dorotheae TaxID=70993 RepID=UPI0003A08B00|nr:ATP-binding protein [Flexithrix dorotheae]